MIIDFTVTNFRSIKDTQTLSMFVENSRGNLPENVVYPNTDKIGVLKTIGIYGANASGKSNILLALQALKYIATGSDELKDGDPIPYEPFLLSDVTKNAPVLFEIEFFTSNKMRFLYMVSFNASRIIKERLDFYPSQTKANLFNRDENSTWENITFGSLYKGGKKRLGFFQNNSYLAKAGNSADSPPVIREAYNFLRTGCKYIRALGKINTVHLLDDQNLLNAVSTILCKVDTGITDVSIENSDSEEEFAFLTGIPDEMKKRFIDSKKRKPFFSHQTASGYTEKFPEHVESDGTQKMFHLLPLLINTFKSGEVLILDELDNHLHPHISELIIKLFNDEQVNINHAQLLFSTHNLQIMSPEFFRRDQIWLTEKKDGATELYSLEAFDKNQVKTNSPYGIWYSDGRFGAVPKIDYRAIASALTMTGVDAKDA